MRQDFLDATGEKLQVPDRTISCEPDLDALCHFAFEVKGQARNYGLTVRGLKAPFS